MCVENVHTLRPKENVHYFAGRQHFNCNFMNENYCIFIQISLKFVVKGQIDSIVSRALVLVNIGKSHGLLPDGPKPWL